MATLPGRHWKWRMHGAAVHFNRHIRSLGYHPDIVLGNDMMDMSTLRGLLCNDLPNTKFYTYFHENQISYPWSPTDPDPALKRDFHYAFINYTTALASDKLFFNSMYHLESFIGGLKQMLHRFPDNVDMSIIHVIRLKSNVLYLGMDSPERGKLQHSKNGEVSIPIILWNHRWEYDKVPELFFEALFDLSDKDIPFKLIVTGESYEKRPAIFEKAKNRLSRHLIHFEYAKSRREYLALLRQADILPVTSKQDFFSGSVVEAIHCGVVPLLPRRLAYPEHIPAAMQDLFLYDNEKMFFDRLKHIIKNINMYIDRLPDIQQHIKRYDWQQIISSYDEQLVK